MASLSALSSTAVSSAAVRPTPAAPANSSAELAKCESQLSDWVHCPSGKTSEGKAKIAEITARIESIKAQVKRAEDARAPQPTHQPTQQAADEAVHAPHRPLRLDQLGTWLDAQA
jgi:hypothetical protein